MHNRDLIWGTNDGRRLKIRDITSAHLTNILNFMEKKHDAYIKKFGKEKVDEYTKVITQEIRLRKLNRIDLESDDEDLF